MISPLFVDCYQYDLNGKPDWWTLVKIGPPYHGGIIKATEGIHYAPSWFDTNWKLLRSIAGGRYGEDWFRGAYHFLKFSVDGRKQADLYLAKIEMAGGWGVGDFWPIVDVELGSEKNTNQLATAQQIVDCTTAFAERCKQVTGRKVMLYGNGAMRDRAISDRMGCDFLWCPRYTTTLPAQIYERAGWALDELVLWQYGGDGYAVLPKYPKQPPGFGKVDMNALVVRGGIQWLRANLWAEMPA